MKKPITLKLIKEELHKEIKINKPINTYRVNSPEYKKFYQFVELCDYWGVDVNQDATISYPLNDFDFFYILYTSALGGNWNPDLCIVDRDGFEIIKDNWGLYDDNKIKELEDKLREHSV
jgi:hypothetical protein